MIESVPGSFQQPALQFDNRTGLFRLVQDYRVTWGSGKFLRRLTCQAGFEYDKASVPRFLWPIARPDGPWEAASLFHDRLYLFKGKLPTGEYEVLIGDVWRADPSPWTRAQADRLLRDFGVMGGASPAEARRYELAVKLWPGNWFKF